MQGGLFADGHLGARARPTPAERFVESDERDGRVTLTHGERIVGRVQRTLRIENGEEALDPPLVEKLRDIRRLCIRGGFRCELIATYFYVCIGHQRILPHAAQSSPNWGVGRAARPISPPAPAAADRIPASRPHSTRRPAPPIPRGGAPCYGR